MSLKQKMKEAGYRHVMHNPIGRFHVLEDINTGKQEMWVVNKNHASYGIKYKNTHLEFVRDWN